MHFGCSVKLLKTEAQLYQCKESTDFYYLVLLEKYLQVSFNNTNHFDIEMHYQYRNAYILRKDNINGAQKGRICTVLDIILGYKDKFCVRKIK